jgi:heptosyltransferase-1
MKVLLIKMSSMGDIFHTFPAVTDLLKFRPDVELHWVVEEGFAEIVSWHPGVKRIIPIALRRWMTMRNKTAWQEFKQWKSELNQTQYDLVIDAQGLFKSLLIAKSSQSNNIQGYDKKSARESWVSFFYHQSYFVDKNLHAVQRTRQLLSKIGQYRMDESFTFGIQQYFAPIEKKPKQLIFIVGTSWNTKLWSAEQWKRLTKIALTEGYQVEIIWGSENEKALADSIMQACPGATRPNERMSITAVAEKLVSATAVVGLDTGFSHLAGALEIPTIALYGATSPIKVGLIGEHTHNLQLDNPLDCMPCHKRQCKLLPEKSTDCPPCLARIEAENVWLLLMKKLSDYRESLLCNQNQ